MSQPGSEPERLRIALGTDDAGVGLRDAVAAMLREDPRVAEVVDVGVADREDKTPYPVPCIRAAEAVRDGHVDRAVLFGGTGLGEAMSANKVRGVRAAVATDPYSVERSVLSNACQVLALGERVVGTELALRVVRAWLGYRFDPSSPSAAKLAVLDGYERTGQLGA